METTTKVHAEDGKQDLTITRAFDLPVELVFKAHVDPDLVAQWMGTNVLKLEGKKHGSYQFETTNAQGDVVFKASGVFHDFVPNQKITRTFEMELAATPAVRSHAQLEFLEFEKLTDNTSQLTMHIIYRLVGIRDQLLRMPFAQGLNKAHNRLQDVVNQLKP
jgi:uncharacterized protein YndB with AHSA1/START domain